jgi:hypothetical protein
MHRFPSLVAALAVIALTAGVAVAHSLPSASGAGIATARAASNHTVPMWRLPEGPSLDTPATDAPSSKDTHGATVSDAASNPTPAGDWANHGAYVSSIAKGWGTQVSSQHASSQAAAHDATGVAHRP